MGSAPTQQWPAILENERQLADYITTWAGADVDRRMVEDHYFGCGARLELVPIDQIKEGPPDSNVRNAKKEARYEKMPLETMPPLVIENGEIDDGNHRFRIAKKKGATEMWCYVVVEQCELTPKPARAAAP